ncbi:hypothetical protein, partial [Sinorhizobium meliloti]
SLQKGNRWPDFTPPAAGLFRRYRGRFLHRRSHMRCAEAFYICSPETDAFIATRKRRALVQME